MEDLEILLQIRGPTSLHSQKGIKIALMSDQGKQLYVAKICQPVSADSSLIALPKDSHQNWNGSQLRLLDDFSHVHGTCLPTEAQATHKELLSLIQITAKKDKKASRQNKEYSYR